jgi:hypothetical protein
MSAPLFLSPSSHFTHDCFVPSFGDTIPRVSVHPGHRREVVSRIEGKSVPVRKAAPVADDEYLDAGSARDHLGRLSLTSSGIEEANNDLARMGLVKGPQGDDDLGVLGLVMFLP